MNLYRRPLYPVFNQKVGHIRTLVSLQLDHRPHRFILDNRSIACKVLTNTLASSISGNQIPTFLNAWSNFL